MIPVIGAPSHECRHDGGPQPIPDGFRGRGGAVANGGQGRGGGRGAGGGE